MSDVRAGQSPREDQTDRDSIFRVCKCTITLTSNCNNHKRLVFISLYNAFYRASFYFIFQLLEENIGDFVKTELKRMQTALRSECLDDEVMDSKDEGEDMRSSREAFLKIVLCFLKKIQQEDLADALQKSEFYLWKKTPLKNMWCFLLVWRYLFKHIFIIALTTVFCSCRISISVPTKAQI